MLDADQPATATGETVVLADYTTIRLGGPAARFERANSQASLLDAVTRADAAGQRLLLLGGGSNLVIGDAGFDGAVVQVAHRGITFTDAADHVQVSVAAGEPWDGVVACCLDADLAGLECLSGIPGLAGATPIQNVGAYGAEISDVVVAVQVFDRATRASSELTGAECRFGYRTSALKGSDRYVVLAVRLALRRSPLAAPVRYAQLAEKLGVELGTVASARDVRAAVLELRAAKGMLVDPADPDSCSAGSFFTNPIVPVELVPADAPRWPVDNGLVKTSAAWLIEQAGFRRGFGSGPVGLSAKHTLALVNRGGATTAELLALARTVRDGVRNAFGIELEVEPTLVGAAL